MQDNTIIKLNDREHVLLRPNMYVGGVDLVEKEEYVLTDNKFKFQSLKFVPGLIKIINEIIDNSVDEAVRTNFKFGNRISVSMTNNSVEIADNGRGIPVVKISNTEHYAPVVAFCEARAGSNFSDDGRTTIGMNGVGSFATNVFSKVFKATTADGNKKLKLTSKNNAEDINFIVTDSDRKYTKVYFEPDFKRFEINEFDDIHRAIIKQRLYFLSVAHPRIKFTFNKEKIHFKSKEHFVKLFSDDYEIFDMKKYFIAVLPNDTDDFTFFSYVNGLHIKNGGNHINLITNDIVSKIRDKMSRRYKNIKPGDIKNKLKLLVFMNDFENMKFDSQTKENLTNSVTHIRTYMNIDQKKFDNWVNYKIYKNEAIIDPILETYRIREEFKKRADLKNMSKPKKRLNIEKYLPPTENKKYLVLAEGDCLEENTKIKCFDEKGYREKKIKDIEIGDKVFTAQHRLKSVEYTTKKVSKGITFKTKSNKEVICSEKHRLLVYSQNKFFYKKAADILKSDKLVSSKSASIDFSEVLNLKVINHNKYSKLLITEKEQLYVTDYLKVIVFNLKTDELYQKNAIDLESGEMIAYYL